MKGAMAVGLARRERPKQAGSRLRTTPTGFGFRCQQPRGLSGRAGGREAGSGKGQTVNGFNGLTVKRRPDTRIPVPVYRATGYRVFLFPIHRHLQHEHVLSGKPHKVEVPTEIKLARPDRAKRTLLPHQKQRRPGRYSTAAPRSHVRRLVEIRSENVKRTAQHRQPSGSTV